MVEEIDNWENEGGALIKPILSINKLSLDYLLNLKMAENKSFYLEEEEWNAFINYRIDDQRLEDFRNQANRYHPDNEMD